MRRFLLLLPFPLLSPPGVSAALVIHPLAWPAEAAVPLTDGFDFPVGPPHAKGFTDAQPFGTHHHLGSDWNAITGGATDLGAPVYAAAHGTVVYARDAGPGWGNVVRVLHRTAQGPIETVYAHLDRIDVTDGDLLQRGTQLGTIGDAHGRYVPHLHFELRTIVGMDLGPGYARNSDGWVDPTAYILAHRPVR